MSKAHRVWVSAAQDCPPSGVNCQVQATCTPAWTLQSEVSTTPSLGAINLLGWITDLKETNLLVYSKGYYEGYRWRDAWGKVQSREGGGVALFIPSGCSMTIPVLPTTWKLIKYYSSFYRSWSLAPLLPSLLSTRPVGGVKVFIL